MNESLQASLDVARKQFLSEFAQLRPKLHRFCARMCGSVLDTRTSTRKCSRPG